MEFGVMIFFIVAGFIAIPFQYFLCAKVKSNFIKYLFVVIFAIGCIGNFYIMDHSYGMNGLIFFVIAALFLLLTIGCVIGIMLYYTIKLVKQYKENN